MAPYSSITTVNKQVSIYPIYSKFISPFVIPFAPLFSMIQYKQINDMLRTHFSKKTIYLTRF